MSNSNIINGILYTRVGEQVGLLTKAGLIQGDLIASDTDKVLLKDAGIISIGGSDMGPFNIPEIFVLIDEVVAVF